MTSLKPGLKSIIFLLLMVSFFSLKAGNVGDTVQKSRIVQNFDSDWRFFNGDAEGAEKQKFNTKKWRLLDVPHDWSIEGEVNRENPTGRGGGFFPTGTGWYRKSFSLTKEESGKRVFIEFDGVMANSEVWINGQFLGKRPNGYVSFSYELTDHLLYGKKENVIAVRADNTIQPASRWYTGAGIYRHVRLVKTDPIHFQQWGVFISTPKVSKEEASVNINSSIVNQSAENEKITIKTILLDPSGKKIGQAEKDLEILVGQTLETNDQVKVDHPQRWDLNQPFLYQAVSRIYKGEILVDEQVNTFGIREFHFDAATGFYLNGENFKIKGVCLHHDGGAVGAAVPIRTWELRISKLKELGVNAIRTAHNPFAPEFYDLCDRMGVLVMNETFDTWRARKNHASEGYNLFFDDWWEADTRDVVLRDRNHPSIILISVGNEIRDNLKNEKGFSSYKKMQDLIHELNPSWLVTMAIFRPNSSGVYDNGFVEMMDIVGQNYRERELVKAHLDNPKRMVLGTENGHSREAWTVLRDHPFMAGQFLWTGVDYLGEADWPATTHESGLIDRAGFVTQRGFQRKSWWGTQPMVHLCRKALNAGNGALVSNWTPADHDTYDEAHVEVYCNTEEFEIFLNGQSKGVFEVPDNAAPVRTKFSFEQGTIKVVAKNKGEIVATHEMQTADESKKIKLTATRMSLTKHFDDVVYITTQVVDQSDVLCPNDDHMLHFSIEGPGEIIAVDNADSENHVPFRVNSKRAHAGQCIAIVRATQNSGEITLNVQSDGLVSNSITLKITE